MSRTRKFTPNAPATANPGLPDVPAKEHIRGKVAAYRIGYQDAVTVTTDMSQAGDRAGNRALDALRSGNSKPYRALSKRRHPFDGR